MKCNCNSVSEYSRGVYQPSALPIVAISSSQSSKSKTKQVNKLVRCQSYRQQTQISQRYRQVAKAYAEKTQKVLYRRYMEEIYEILAQRLFSAYQAVGPHSDRIMVGVAGIPGSGKSTLARAVAGRVNQIYHEQPSTSESVEDIITVVPMDGYHYTKAQLASMPNPKQAFSRRGAPWTFDAPSFVQLLQKLREDEGVVRAPSFDHGVGDPVPDALPITSSHRIILVEGNYLLLDDDPWCTIPSLLNETWYIECNVSRAMDRVFLRQTSHGVSEVDSAGRIETNDEPNAMQIAKYQHKADIVVPSVPFRDLVGIW